jgi:hypothetical protein
VFSGGVPEALRQGLGSNAALGSTPEPSTNLNLDQSTPRPQNQGINVVQIPSPSRSVKRCDCRVPDARMRYLAGRIYGLGPRPLYELFCEIDAGADLHAVLEAYARLPAEFIAAHGGDRLPSLRAVDGGSRD